MPVGSKLFIDGIPVVATHPKNNDKNMRVPEGEALLCVRQVARHEAEGDIDVRAQRRMARVSYDQENVQSSTLRTLGSAFRLANSQILRYLHSLNQGPGREGKIRPWEVDVLQDTDEGAFKKLTVRYAGVESVATLEKIDPRAGGEWKLVNFKKKGADDVHICDDDVGVSF